MNILKNIEFGRILEQFKRLKECVSEWIISIDTKQYDLAREVQDLRLRIFELESEIKQSRFQNGRWWTNRRTKTWEERLYKINQQERAKFFWNGRIVQWIVTFLYYILLFLL